MKEPGRRLPLERERDRRPRALARLACCPRPAAAASPSSRRTIRSASSNTPNRARRPRGIPGFSTQRRLTRASCAANAAENGSSCTSRSGPVTSLRSANSRSNSAGTSAQSKACSRTLSARGGVGRRPRLARAGPDAAAPPRGARGPTVTNARVRSSLSRTENSIGPAAVAGSASTMIPSRAAGSSSATAGVASSAASTSSDDGPSPVARRGMSGTIGGTFGPMSAGSVSSGGYTAGPARLEAIAGVAGARQRDVVVARPGRKRQADLCAVAVARAPARAVDTSSSASGRAPTGAAVNASAPCRPLRPAAPVPVPASATSIVSSGAPGHQGHARHDLDLGGAQPFDDDSRARGAAASSRPANVRHPAAPSPPRNARRLIRVSPTQSYVRAHPSVRCPRDQRRPPRFTCASPCIW